MNHNHIKTVLVTGGAGYVGSALVPELLKSGYNVRVLDLYMYGDVLKRCRENENYAGRLQEFKGDLRDTELLDRSIKGVDAVIHLACISNDPSYELNPELGKSINYDAFFPLVELSKKHQIKRFVYASSSSVYGIKNEPNVTEDLPLEPLTDYSKYKALCEQVLLDKVTDEFTVLIARPSTVCGYAPRLRLDLSVNILTNFAINKGEILVFGGDQKRPNIHIDDMVRFYLKSLEWDHAQIHRKIYNVGFDNYTINEIAEAVRSEIGPQVTVKKVPTDDNRSYHVSSEKIFRELGFKATRTIRDAVKDLKSAFAEGWIPNSFGDDRYFNIKTMQKLNLQ